MKQSKSIPDGFVASHLAQGFGVEDIGLKLRKIGVDVQNDSIRKMVNFWRATNKLPKILGLDGAK